MTTTTVPDVDLAAWLAGEVEERCQVTAQGVDCTAVAEWLLTYERCDCVPNARGFMCTPHKDIAELVELVCDLCGPPCRLTFTERIR